MFRVSMTVLILCTGAVESCMRIVHDMKQPLVLVLKSGEEGFASFGIRQV